MFGIRVRNPRDGSRLGLWSLQREAWVLVRTSIALPVSNLFTMISSYTDLRTMAPPRWGPCPVRGSHAPATRRGGGARAIVGGVLVFGSELVGLHLTC